MSNYFEVWVNNASKGTIAVIKKQLGPSDLRVLIHAVKYRNNAKTSLYEIVGLAEATLTTLSVENQRNKEIRYLNKILHKMWESAKHGIHALDVLENAHDLIIFEASPKKPDPFALVDEYFRPL